MRAKLRTWTPEETALAMKMLDERAPEHEFIEKLGRTRNCVRAKRDRMQFLSATRSVVEQPGKITVPLEVWIERSRRLYSPRSITARLCGDPPFHQSALGKKMSESKQ